MADSYQNQVVIALWSFLSQLMESKTGRTHSKVVTCTPYSTLYNTLCSWRRLRLPISSWSRCYSYSPLSCSPSIFAVIIHFRWIWQNSCMTNSGALRVQSSFRSILTQKNPSTAEQKRRKSNADVDWCWWELGLDENVCRLESRTDYGYICMYPYG